MSRALVLGDPSSVSRLATDAARSARDLQDCATALEELLAPLRERRSTRVERDLAGRLRTLIEATRASARTLETFGRHLQSQSADLSVLRGDLGRIREEIAAAGLVLQDGRALLPWGITGVAAAEEDSRREAARQALQAKLDHLARLAARRAGSLADVLVDTAAQWAEVAASMRH